MNANQFISFLEGLLTAQDKETKLSKAIRAKLTQVTREEWVPPYFERETGPVVPVRKLGNKEFPPYLFDGPMCGTAILNNSKARV